MVNAQAKEKPRRNQLANHLSRCQKYIKCEENPVEVFVATDIIMNGHARAVIMMNNWNQSFGTNCTTYSWHVCPDAYYTETCSERHEYTFCTPETLRCTQ